MKTAIKKLLIIALFIPFLVTAQQKDDKGIVWAKESGWDQLIAKANKEKKFIFVDCFATWCVPCKYMDKDVYSLSSVGSIMDKNFISIRLQMDTTIHDHPETIKWYSTAHVFLKKFKVAGMPTYLFFSPEGKILHKDVGKKNPTEFLSMVENALQPEKQYYTLLNIYESNPKGNIDLRYLAKFAKKIGEEKVAIALANDYIGRLFQSNSEDIFTRNNLLFIELFTRSSNDMAFQLFYNEAEKVDNILEVRNFSRNKVDRIITAEELEPAMREALDSNRSSVNWTALSQRIKSKYGISRSDRVVMRAKETFYSLTKNWQELHKVYLERFKKYGIEKRTGGPNENEDGVTNNMAWDIFLHSTDSVMINAAIGWSNSILEKMSPEHEFYEWYMDTYANLLYKAGRTAEAIKWETKAWEHAIPKGDKQLIQSLNDVLDKMIKGQPTWLRARDSQLTLSKKWIFIC